MKNSKIIQRLQVVEAAQQLGVGKAAELFKINRKTVGGWLAKYLEQGMAGLQSNYAVKKVQPQGMTVEESARILALKAANPRFSAARIKAELALPYSLTAINKKIRSSQNSRQDNSLNKQIELQELRFYSGKNRLIDGYQFRFVLVDLQTSCNYYGFTNEYSRNSVLHFLHTFQNSRINRTPIRVLHNLPFIKESSINGVLLSKVGASKEQSAACLIEKQSFIPADEHLSVEKFCAIQLCYNQTKTAENDAFLGQFPIFSEQTESTSISVIIAELCELATAFSLKNQLNAAKSAFTTAILLAKRENLLEIEADLYLKLSRFQQKNSEMQQATATIKTAIGFCSAHRLIPALIKAYGIYGILLQSAGNNRAAAIFLNKQYKLSCEKSLPSEQIQAALSLGVLYNNLGNYAKSLAFYQQVIELSKNSGQKAQKLTALGNIGVIYWRKNKILQGLEYFKAALNMAIESCNSRQMARMYGNIGAVYDEMHDTVQAQFFYEKQLKLATEIRNESLQSAALANLGGIYQSAGNYKQALELLNSALLITEKRSDKEKTAVILGEIAAIYYKTGSILPALTQINWAIKLSLATGESYYLGSFYLQKAEIYFTQNKINQAKNALQLAKSAFDQAERADLNIEYAILNLKINFLATPLQLLAELENLWQLTRSADGRKEISAEITDYALPLNKLPPSEKHSAYLAQYQRKLQKKSAQAKC